MKLLYLVRHLLKGPSMFHASAMSIPTALLVVLLSSGKGSAEGRPPEVTDAAPNFERRWLEAVSDHLISTTGAKTPRSEGVEMIEAIMKGKMGPGQGWFHPGRSRLDWNWLAARFDADKDGNITRKEFKGSARMFDRLDRDHDGVITREDLDWSGYSEFMRKNFMVQHWFSLLDGNSNGRISRPEWDAAFSRAARGKNHMTPEDVFRLLFPPAPAPVDVKLARKGSDDPSPQMLLKGLFAGELGSPFEGPRVGQAAPLFTLPTHDGSRKIALADHLGKKPIVLIFGSFT
jgi:hypothetical protein